jgi:hypothetical protein
MRLVFICVKLTVKKLFTQQHRGFIMNIKDLKKPKIKEAVQHLLSNELNTQELYQYLTEEGFSLEEMIDLSLLATEVEQKIRQKRGV